MRRQNDKSAVKVYKADKLLYFLLRLQHRPFSYSHFYLTIQDNKSKVFYVGMFKLAFVMSEEKLVFSEDVQNFSDDSAVLFLVFGEDEDVVDVYAYDAMTDEVLEYIIHHGLDSGRWPGC
jgi:hypothetical protein